jgi:hypothetical protein
MEPTEFANLLFSHKRLWVALQEMLHLRDYPEDNPALVHEKYQDIADESYLPLERAALGNFPCEDELQTVLQSALKAEAEVPRH